MSCLRPYQLRAIDRVRDHRIEGYRRILLVLPTGGGKSRIAAQLIKLSLDRGKRALFLAHRIELVEQAARVFRAEGIPTGIIAASADEPEDPQCQCQVASMDTLLARGVRPPADLVIPDEAHHVVAGSYKALLGDYGRSTIVGLTANPCRGDGLGLRDGFDSLVVGSTVRELTDAGFLVPLRAVRPETMLRSGQIAQRVSDAYLAHAPGTRAIVFSPTVALAEEHADELCAAGVRAQVVYGGMPATLRAERFAAFRSGELDVLTNCALICEGVDIPECGTIVLARGVSAIGLFDQMLGRAVRPAPGKTEAVLIDLRGSSYLHTLPYEGREFSLDGEGIRRGVASDTSYCAVCGQIRVAGIPCPDCGHEPEPPTLKVTGAELVKYDYRTQLAGDAPDVRFARLVRWIRAAMAKGHKLGAAKGRYFGTYGQWPRVSDWERALLEARG